MSTYFVYILTNKPHGTLYIGVTNNLKRRVIEHRLGLVDGFTKKYALKKLVHAEQFEYVNNAIHREKQLKRWHREWKINLVEEQNPGWNDLYETIFGPDNASDTEWILKQVHNCPKCFLCCTNQNIG